MKNQFFEVKRNADNANLIKVLIVKRELAARLKQIFVLKESDPFIIIN